MKKEKQLKITNNEVKIILNRLSKDKSLFVSLNEKGKIVFGIPGKVKLVKEKKLKAKPVKENKLIVNWTFAIRPTTQYKCEIADEILALTFDESKYTKCKDGSKEIVLKVKRV